MKKSKMMKRYERETGEIIMQYGDTCFFGYIAWLKSLAIQLKPNITPAQENAYRTPPSDSKAEKV